MTRPLHQWFLWPWLSIALTGAISTAADADPITVEVAAGARWDWLVVDFRCVDLFVEGVREALDSGLPTRVALSIEVWQERSTLWDRHVHTVDLSYRVVFDVLEERYAVYDDVGELVAASDSLATVERLVGSEHEFEVIELAELDGRSQYFVSLSVELQPLSVREIRDLERWLRGSLGGRGDGVSGISDHLLGVLKNQVGMGERRAQARSAPFRLGQLQQDGR